MTTECPNMGEVKDGVVSVNGRDVAVVIKEAMAGLPLNPEAECKFKWMVEMKAKGAFSAAVMRCERCNASIRLGKFEGND